MVSQVHVPGGAVSPGHEPIKAIPVRHWGQWVSAAIVITIVGALAYSVGTNPNLQWSIVWQYLFDNTILRGMLVTIELTVLAMVAGLSMFMEPKLMQVADNSMQITAPVTEDTPGPVVNDSGVPDREIAKTSPLADRDR